MLHISGAGIETGHPAEYRIDRLYPPELGLWVILCFANDCLVKTIHGTQLATAGDCMIKSPGMVEYARTPPGQTVGFINDWIHVRSEEVGPLLEMLQLPADCLIHTGDPRFFRTYLQEILREESRHLMFWEQKSDALLREMLVHLARYVSIHGDRMTEKYYLQLRRLRSEIQGDLKRNWTVQLMADAVGLSTGYFSRLYCSQFGVSPITDVIDMRLREARLQLLRTDATLREVADACGFRNEYYFSTIFRKKFGMSPGFFRRNSG